MGRPETRYATTVTAVGEQVPEFAGQGLLIWFAEGAPEELPLPEPRPGTELVIEGDAAAADPHR